MSKPLDVLRRICTVPGTDLPLSFASDASSSGPDGTRYGAVRGVPILRSEAASVVEHPTNYASGGVGQDVVDRIGALPGYTLFLGAGNSTFRQPRVIEVEHDLFRDTDVVADAHSLPFHSDTFDLFFAMNVFEHLRRPFEAAREALRVLKPGGEVHIHTAFLQPLHESPRHFYNATEFGVRGWFEDFAEVQCTVSANFNPLYTVSWVSDELLAAAERTLGPEARRALGRLTLEEVALFWREREGWNPEATKWFFEIPEAAQRPIAAGFELRARKPAGD